VRGHAERRAVELLDGHARTFRRLGYRVVERRPLAARLEPEDGRTPIRLRMAAQGRFFGGMFALELATAEPVLARTKGVRGRGRGVVALRGVSFAGRARDEAGAQLARLLEADRRLGETLARVHFERIRVEPDGTPVIRHMGGSLVWVLFPPLVRPVPLVEEQARASVDALEAFARAGAT
jgi:hypothetical protein